MPRKARKVIGSRARYKILDGGRGGGKSYAFANGLIGKALFGKFRILCTREMQNSIRDSVHRLLTDRIHALGFEKYFTVQRESITSNAGSDFIFKGLRHNISEIKSMEGVDVCWCEEAEKITRDSWDTLIPTIRKENSELWITFNPEEERSATYQKFIVNPPPDCLRATLNYWDNKYFPEVLRREMEYDKRVDHEKYLHVWEGKVKRYGQSVIFSGKIFIEAFETPANAEFKFGADFGFSADPSVLGRMFIKDRILFIDHEAFAHGIEIEELPAFYDTVPESRKWKIIADSERPDTISFLNRKGFHIVGAQKGKGSVEDGIQFLRSFEKIVIHPRCKGAKDNFENYRWKEDRVTKEILPIPAEGSDHWPDSARYALEDYIKAKEPLIRWL